MSDRSKRNFCSPLATSLEHPAPKQGEAELAGLLLREESVNHALGICVAAHHLEGIADAIATRVGHARKIADLELSAHKEMALGRSCCARAERSNDVDGIIDSIGGSEASAGDVHSRDQCAGGTLDSVFNAGGVDKASRHVTQIYYTVDFGEDGARKVEGGKGSEAILSKKPWTVAAWSAYAPTILPRLLTERARVQAAPGTSTVVYFQSCRDGIRAE